MAAPATAIPTSLAPLPSAVDGFLFGIAGVGLVARPATWVFSWGFVGPLLGPNIGLVGYFDGAASTYALIDLTLFAIASVTVIMIAVLMRSRAGESVRAIRAARV